MRELTKKQARILEFVQEFSKERGYPPTIREIGSNFRIGPRAAKEHLDAIEKKGFIRRKKGARMIEISPEAKTRFEGIPVVGKVAADTPVLAEENLESYLRIDESLTHGEEVFFLKVRGDSMKGSGIFDKDLVLVKKQAVASNGDIVVIRIEDEATVKRYQRRKNRIFLLPDNPEFDPIEINQEEDFEILGKVIGLWRRV